MESDMKVNITLMVFWERELIYGLISVKDLVVFHKSWFLLNKPEELKSFFSQCTEVHFNVYNIKKEKNKKYFFNLI